MKRGQRPSAERVVLMLGQIEVQTARGKSIAVACKEVDVSEQSYYRWQGVRRSEGQSGQEDEGSGARERPASSLGGRSISGEAGAGGHRLGTLAAPERRRQAVDGAREKYGLAPGAMLSASHAFPNAVRINCGIAWSAQTERAYEDYGQILQELQ